MLNFDAIRAALGLQGPTVPAGNGLTGGTPPTTKSTLLCLTGVETLT